MVTRRDNQGDASRKPSSTAGGKSSAKRVQVSAGASLGGRGASRAAGSSRVAVSRHQQKHLGAVNVEASHGRHSAFSGGGMHGGTPGRQGIFSRIGGFFSGFFRSKLLKAALAIICVVGLATLVDSVVNGNRIYNGVHVGDVNLSGKSVDEAKQLIEERYGSSLESTRILIFASEEAATSIDVDEQIAQYEALAEQVSVEEMREGRELWWTNASLLGALLPAEELALEAYQVGREDGGLFARLRAAISDWQIPIRASYDDTAVEALANDIDLAIGNPRVDYGMVINEGVATLVEGHDGYMLNRDGFYQNLNDCFFSDASGDASFIAVVEHAPLRINLEQAQAACNAANAALSQAVSFKYGEEIWEISAADLASWIATNPQSVRRGHELDVLLDAASAKPVLLSKINEAAGGGDIVVDFEESDSGITVLTDGTVEVAQLDQAVALLDKTLFGDYRSGIGLDASSMPDLDMGQVESTGAGFTVSIVDGLVPEKLSLQEAIDCGLVTEVSSFTTEYVNSSSTQNRRHNIHHAADIISGSIVQSGGGEWSFNERVGECTTEAGFLGAGAIVAGEYDDAVGGGICQVATTVFNSVYEGGYPVVRRHNHSLYIASYPTGRDAAIAYPHYDLIWRNDSTSDVLMQCSYTDSTLTVSLYSVYQGYVVSSKEGDWAEGEKHGTKIERDEEAKPGSSYVKTAGRDGRKITVYRTVTDADGNILIEDAFSSTYSPVTEVIVEGPKLPDDEEGDSQDT